MIKFFIYFVYGNSNCKLEYKLISKKKDKGLFEILELVMKL